MTVVRPAAVAGMFYPGTRAALSSLVGDLLADAASPEDVVGTLPAPKALIVPHAGYIYSGAVAALGYALVALHKCTITKVVVLGPTHRVAVRGIALPGADTFATPLGEVSLDSSLVGLAGSAKAVVTRSDVHAQEHSIEVQIPFLQAILGHFTLLPLAVGDATPDEVAAVLDAVWGGPETLIVVSSDLSHYHRYEQAQRLDAETIAEIAALHTPIHPARACGAYPINGLLTAAPRHGLTPRLLGCCNSGDTAGDRSQVVGYASFAFDQVYTRQAATLKEP